MITAEPGNDVKVKHEEKGRKGKIDRSGLAGLLPSECVHFPQRPLRREN